MRTFDPALIELARQAQLAPMDDRIAKAWFAPDTATSGIQLYNLQAPALNLFPVITPLRNALPRPTTTGSIQANWRAITGINVGNMSIGVGEGNRGGVTITSTADYMAKFITFGLEDFVTQEADWAADGFQDLKATAAMNLLTSVMIGEEKMILGGNGSLPLGITPTPTATDVATGGTLLAATQYSLIAVGLTPDGFSNNNAAAGLVPVVTRTNADGSTQTYGNGVAQKSANQTVTTASDASNTHCVNGSVPGQVGAVAYAWYFGLPGQERIYSITTISSVKVTSLPTSTQPASALPASDNSVNSLLCDGLLSISQKSGGYYLDMPVGTPGIGTGLTATTKGGIVEIDTALLWFWDNYRLSPDCLWVNSQEQNWINQQILTGSTTMAQRFVFTTDQSGIRGGVAVKSYTNPFTMNGASDIKIQIHPNLPPGTMMFTTSALPYPLNGVPQIARMLCQQDYFQMEWPMRTRKYEYGVYCRGVLQHYFPPSLGIIKGIANQA